MLISINKIQLRHDFQENIATTLLASSEMVFATDTGRLLVGHDPSSGNMNFNRTRFPQDAIEILTESSPRNRELFSQNIRNQDKEAFFSINASTRVTILSSGIVFGSSVAHAYTIALFSAIGSIAGSSADNAAASSTDTTMGLSSGISVAAAIANTKIAVGATVSGSGVALAVGRTNVSIGTMSGSGAALARHG